MLKTTLINLRNQCAYTPTLKDLFHAGCLLAIVILAAAVEGGVIL